MKTSNSEKKIGKVKWFNNAKGYGFILADGSTEDLFAHYSTIQMQGYRTLKAGQTVQFEIEPSEKGSHAVNIVCIDDHTINNSESGENPSADTIQINDESMTEKNTEAELEPSI